MRDPRLEKLAGILLDHSCRLQKGEKVLVEAFDLEDPSLVCELVEGAAARGALAVVNLHQNRILRSQYRSATEESMKLAGAIERHRMEQMDAYIGIRGALNGSELSDVPSDKLDLFQTHWWHPVHGQVRVPKTKWVVLRYPTHAMAQAAKMSTETFTDYFFDVCTADYAKMARDQEPLRKRMEEAKRVRLVAPGTELHFSIEGIPVVACNGGSNIPDGEVFTAPVLDSVEGKVSFNAPSLYQGTVFERVELTFEKGRVVAESSSETAKLTKILDSDEGARRLGEWSIGCNNRVRHPMMDTLFDEKIGGSLHMALGNAYNEADNGNRSRIHWDLVLIQNPEYGGGEIWFDGELLRKDGKFIPEDLHPLNEGL